MRAQLLLFPLAAVALALSGCSVSVTPTASPTETSQESPTVDPTLIPSASPTEIINVDAAKFLTQTGEYLFKVGTGPVWCTVVADQGEAVCEMNEADAQYKPVTPPDTCEYSYGYQISLLADKPADKDIAGFLCAGGYYSDPLGAETLNSGESISAGDFYCFVQGATARCENSAGNFIALGPKAWALGN